MEICVCVLNFTGLKPFLSQPLLYLLSNFLFLRVPLVLGNRMPPFCLLTVVYLMDLSKWFYISQSSLACHSANIIITGFPPNNVCNKKNIYSFSFLFFLLSKIIVAKAPTNPPAIIPMIVMNPP